MSQTLKELHRTHLYDIGRAKGVELAYYQDVYIEPPVASLVSLLNNEFTITTHSCGGHWKESHFQYPYVQFLVFERAEVWREIVAAVIRRLKMRPSEPMLLDVTQGFRLPDTSPTWECWRLCSSSPLSFRRSRDLFGSEQEFNEAVSKAVERATEALSNALNEHRSWARSFQTGFDEAFQYQLQNARPLTDGDLSAQDAPRICGVSEEIFGPGDIPLRVCIPAPPDEPLADCYEVVARKSVLERRTWRYYPVSEEFPVPRVVDRT